MSVQAIETEYNGYRFRSRLEARWAVFFDHLGIRFEYEPEGFQMPDGERYLPDFFLPRFDRHPGLYVEVKPDGGDFGKARRFAEASGRYILQAEGQPDFRPYRVVEPAEPGGSLQIEACFDGWYSAKPEHGGEYRLFYTDWRHETDWDEWVSGAVYAARSARFEARP